MNFHKIFLLWGWALASCHLSANATEPSSPWPQRPITMIVPFVAGGATDTVARLLSPRLSATIGQPVVVENVVGASGTLGARKLTQSTPDGHVLMYGGLSETVLIPQGGQRVGYQPQDLLAVAILASTPVVLAVRKNFPGRSLDAMIQLARAAPMKYTYGSAGVGSYGHLMLEAIAHQQGMELLHVPYKGSSQMLVDMASGQIDLALTSMPSAVAYATSHRIDLLAVSAPQRLTDWPSLPTFAESSSLGKAQITIWGGLFAPRGLPGEIALKINHAFAKVLKDEDIRAKLSHLGITVEAPRSPSESQTFYDSQIRQYQPLARPTLNP